MLLLAPCLIGAMTILGGIVVPLVLIGLSLGTIYLILVFKQPFLGVVSILFIGFFEWAFTRELVEVPMYVIDAMTVATWAAALGVSKSTPFTFRGNDLLIVLLIWTCWSVLMVLSPSASIAGWIRELRVGVLLPFLVVSLGFAVIETHRQLDCFLALSILFSLIGALNGIKQLHIGLSPGEQAFLDDGGEITHVLFGQLRVFSFYSDAGQFGASQAQFALMCFVLFFGKFTWWKRMLLLVFAGVLFYGMLISGTRGALFALLAGGVVAIFLSKKLIYMLSGAFVLLLFVGFLKFTYIGNTNYSIYRLRTALDFEDASLNVRLVNQERLHAYLNTRPFGDGLGTIGYNGVKYNPGTYLASVAPDSYWVKVWAMYGIVGFTVWFSMMMYILGRGCGIVWAIRHAGLRIKLLALTAGYAGIFVCSYGNEVMNYPPSSYVMYLSWVFIFLGPRFDQYLSEKEQGEKVKVRNYAV